MLDEPRPKKVEELNEQLNRKFYNSFDVAYFSDRALVLACTIAKSGDIIQMLRTGFEVGKIKVEDIKEIQDISIIRSAKRDIVINSYHSIETFFRLLFAHVENPECPWIGLADLNDVHEFKKRLRKLVKDEYFRQGNKSAFVQLVSGSREVFASLNDEQWSKHSEHIHDIILNFANDVLKSPDYNIHKHGAALFETSFGFNLGNIIEAVEQETYLFINKHRYKTEKAIVEDYTLTYKFAKWEYRFASTIICKYLLTNLMNVSATRLGVKVSVELLPFDKIDPKNFIETGIVAESLGELLFSRHKPRTVS